MDRGGWQATVHGVAKSQTRLNDSAHTRAGEALLRLGPIGATPPVYWMTSGGCQVTSLSRPRGCALPSVDPFAVIRLHLTMTLEGRICW